MADYLLAPYNTPFFYSLMFLLVILGLELISLLMGAGLSEIIDNVFDATDVGIGDIDADVDMDSDVEMENSFLSRYIAWIKVKNVPMLILLIVFLGCFSIVGYVGQNVLVRVGINPLATWLAGIIAVVVAFPLYKIVSGYLGRSLFKEETSALSEKTFVGEIIEINSGVARKGLPAEGKFKDRYGQLHYFLVEPEETEDEFEPGTKVKLISKDENTFKAIKVVN